MLVGLSFYFNMEKGSKAGTVLRSHVLKLAGDEVGEFEVSPSPHPRICWFFILRVGEGLVTDHNGKGTEILLSESSHHEQADLKISGFRC